MGYVLGRVNRCNLFEKKKIVGVLQLGAETETLASPGTNSDRGGSPETNDSEKNKDLDPKATTGEQVKEKDPETNEVSCHVIVIIVMYTAVPIRYAAEKR